MVQQTQRLLFLLLICFTLPNAIFAQDYTPDTKGWTTLYDNSTGTSQWRTYKNQPNTSWKVVDGFLYCSTDSTVKRADLTTKKQYADFELYVVWKIEKAENSGIIYRANEDHDYSFQSGPEYQLIDDVGYPEKIEDYQKSGADYGMYAPMVNAAKPAGEWNTTVIKMTGNHGEYWLNGKKTVDYVIGSDDWEERKEHSKWKDEADYDAMKTGYICLQDHGGGVWFKEIKIKDLSAKQ